MKKNVMDDEGLKHFWKRIVSFVNESIDKVLKNIEDQLKEI